MKAATYSAPWPPAPDGRFRVALYKALWNVTPVVYRQHSFSDHRTLKAAARRLAHLIARQSKAGYSGERYDSLYIVTPDGERLALRTAQKRIRESGHAS